ncbi:MAG TPA: phage tail tube protein [Thiobacillus sp.]
MLTKINGLQSFNGLDGSADELETSDLDSEAKEYISGLVDEGKFGFEVKLLSADAGQIALRAARTSGEPVGLELTLPDATVATFDVLVKSFPISGQTNTVMKTTVDTKITGPVVWA